MAMHIEVRYHAVGLTNALYAGLLYNRFPGSVVLEIFAVCRLGGHQTIQNQKDMACRPQSRRLTAVGGVSSAERY